MVRVDQHVDDLAQCAVDHQTAVIKHIVEAAEIITSAFGRLSLADVKTETLLGGLLELGILFRRRENDLRPGSRHGEEEAPDELLA